MTRAHWWNIAGSALLLVAGASMIQPRAAEADPVAGSYSMALVAAQPEVASGGSFVLQAVIDRGSNPPYQALQWNFRYDPAFVRLDEAVVSTGAPAVCSLISTTEPEVLLGCIDLSGPFVDFSGPAFDVRMTCLQDASIELVLDPGSTFVAGEQGVYFERHLHSAVVNCGAGGPTVVVPTATENPEEPPPVPVPTGESHATPLPITPGALTPSATSPGGSTPGAEPMAVGTGADATDVTPGTATNSDAGEEEGDDASDRRVWLWIAAIAGGGLAAAAGMAYLFTRRAR